MILNDTVYLVNARNFKGGKKQKFSRINGLICQYFNGFGFSEEQANKTKQNKNQLVNDMKNASTAQMKWGRRRRYLEGGWRGRGKGQREVVIATKFKREEDWFFYYF